MATATFALPAYSMCSCFISNKPSAVREPALTEWEEPLARAQSRGSPEKNRTSAPQALSRLEEVDLGSSDRNENSDSWVFTQVARASTELTAMLIDAIFPEKSRYLR